MLAASCPRLARPSRITRRCCDLLQSWKRLKLHARRLPPQLRFKSSFVLINVENTIQSYQHESVSMHSHLRMFFSTRRTRVDNTLKLQPPVAVASAHQELECTCTRQFTCQEVFPRQEGGSWFHFHVQGWSPVKRCSRGRREVHGFTFMYKVGHLSRGVPEAGGRCMVSLAPGRWVGLRRGVATLAWG